MLDQMTTDSALVQVLHAHIRIETITDFSLQSSFQAYSVNSEHPRSSHGFLCNIRSPTHTHFGCATPKQGRKLHYEIVWQNLMGYLLLIILIGIPYYLLIMLQGTGQHKTYARGKQY